MKALLVAGLLAGLASAAAGEPGTGSRVRVTLIERTHEPVVGTLLALPPGRIQVDDRSIARVDVAKLEVSRGVTSNAGRYALIGALGLGVAAGVIAAIKADPYDNPMPPPVAGVVYGDRGIAIGGVGGALIGGASRSERWETYRLQP
jgi:hypothetical protein